MNIRRRFCYFNVLKMCLCVSKRQPVLCKERIVFFFMNSPHVEKQVNYSLSACVLKMLTLSSLTQLK